MKNLARNMFSPLSNHPEQECEHVYKRSHRVILIAVSTLFLFLGSLSLMLAPTVDYLFPALVFGAAGLLGLIVGWAAKDIAIARI